MPTIDMSRAIIERISTQIPGAEVSAKMNGDRHYTITVKSASFSGETMLACHRKVMSAIAPLMDGDDAQVHAIDSLRTSAS
jgi:stress-induced morphogen